ncbi:MAG: D-alanine--D-alanine ligase [Alphaproteobacteria bacterium]|nr:D-alanine--D-alanine ligase [Alphaproteobacteria bacterium]
MALDVLVLHDAVAEDGPPDQLDALEQAEVFRRALPDCRVRIAPFGPAVVPRALAADVVVNLVESIDGDGRRGHMAAAMLGACGVRYTGNDAAVLALTGDKELTKAVLAAAGLAVPASWPEGGPRWIVKSRWEDASLGLEADCIVSAADLPAAAHRLAPRLGGEVVVETFVQGEEVNVAILEIDGVPRVLPMARIAFDLPAGQDAIVGYRAKWEADSPEALGTPRSFDLGGLDVDALHTGSLRAWEAAGLRGYARVDWRVPADGPPVVLELNANPCLSPDAGFMAAAGQAGLAERDVVLAILRAAGAHP